MSGQQPVSTIGTGHRFETARIAENNQVRPLYVSVPHRAVEGSRVPRQINRKALSMTDRKNQGSLDVDGEDVIDGNTGGQPADRGDDGFKFKAMREAVRQRSDGLIVTSDLEDHEEREAAPGTREQD